MPDYPILIAYIVLNIFTVFHAQQAMELAAEYNPSSKIFKVSSGLGMLGQYIYPILFAVFMGAWYWGLGMLIIGIVVSAVMFNLVRGLFPVNVRITLTFLGFIGIPVSIASLAFFSVNASLLSR